ncbi:MAG: DinB family protein, partial [Casimicrobiaceae bacterium]
MGAVERNMDVQDNRIFRVQASVTSDPVSRVCSESPPRSPQALGDALRDAREYTRELYSHLSESQQRFPVLDCVNPPRWELGHLAWFQEFWCRRYRPDDPTGASTPSRWVNADALWDS